MNTRQHFLILVSAASMLALSNCVVPEGGSSRPDGGSSTSSWAGRPDIRMISSGYEADFGGNSMAKFDRNGGLVSHANCTGVRLAEAERAVASYIRDNGAWRSASSSSPPEVRPRNDGKIEVRMASGCVILYDARGRLVQKGRSCGSAEVSRANQAVQTYLKEQNDPRGYSGV